MYCRFHKTDAGPCGELSVSRSQNNAVLRNTQFFNGMACGAKTDTLLSSRFTIVVFRNN
jgi:hypothetical protein